MTLTGQGQGQKSSTTSGSDGIKAPTLTAKAKAFNALNTEYT